MCLDKKTKEFYNLKSKCTGKLWYNDPMMPALLQYICILHEYPVSLYPAHVSSTCISISCTSIQYICIPYICFRYDHPVCVYLEYVSVSSVYV